MRTIWIEAALAVVLLGFVSVLIKAISANAYTIGIFRLAVASVGIYVLLGVRRDLFDLDRRDWLALAGMGFCFGGHWLLFFFSIKLSTASVAALALSSYGVYVLFLAWLIRGVKPGWLDWLALAIAIAGNLLIVPEFSLQNEIVKGLLLGLASGFLFACMPIWHQSFQHIPGRTRTFGQFFFALLFFLIFLPRASWQLTAPDWAGLAVLAVLCTLLAHSLWIRVISGLSTLISSLIYYLMIPVAMMGSYFFLGEDMAAKKLVGAALILSANLTGLLSRRKLSGS